MPQISERMPWVDAAKGFGILLVVAGHSLRGIDAEGLIDPVVFSTIDHRIYSFHMPLFFMISGLFFLPQLQKQSAHEFLWSKCFRLIYPLVLWTYIFVGLKFAADILAGRPVEWSNLMVLPFPGQWHFWFLWALFLVQLLLLAAKPLLNLVTTRAFAVSILAVSVLLLLLKSVLQQALPWAEGLLIALPYFAIGMLLGQLMNRLPPIPVLFPVATFCVLIWLEPQIASAGLLAQTGLAMVLSCCVLAVFSRLADERLVRLAAVLGVASMAIFVSHTIFSAFLREMLLQAGITDTVTHVCCGIAIGLLGPLTLFFLTRRLAMRRWLGF
ncbi:acyltransferase family protein [Roseibium sp. M-1]